MYPPLTVRLRQGPPHRPRVWYPRTPPESGFPSSEFVRPACVDSISPAAGIIPRIFRIMEIPSYPPAQYRGWPASGLPGATFPLTCRVECLEVTAGGRESPWLMAHAWPA